MIKAKMIARGLVIENNKPTEKEHQEHMDRLKPEINNLLHQFLPEELTLKEVEILAMVINEIVWSPRTFLDYKIEE